MCLYQNCPMSVLFRARTEDNSSCSVISYKCLQAAFGSLVTSLQKAAADHCTQPLPSRRYVTLTDCVCLSVCVCVSVRPVWDGVDGRRSNGKIDGEQKKKGQLAHQSSCRECIAWVCVTECLSAPLNDHQQRQQASAGRD